MYAQIGHSFIFYSHAVTLLQLHIHFYADSDKMVPDRKSWFGGVSLKRFYLVEKEKK